MAVLAKMKEMSTHHQTSTSTTQAQALVDENKSSSKLIVDFPVQPRRHDQKATTKKKSVRFVDYSELALFEPYHTTINPNELWYNEADKIEFKQQRLEDVCFTRKMVAAASKLRGITREQLFQSIGVENILTQERARGIANRQRQHSQTVLLNQDTSSPDELCAISRHSSKNARLRAYTVASTWAKYRVD